MKKTNLMSKVVSMAMATALFCTVAASAASYESPIPEYYEGSYGKNYKVTSILYEDSRTSFRGSVWAQTKDSSNVPRDTIGCMAMLCDGEDGRAFYTGEWSYNPDETYFHYVVTPQNHWSRSVFAKGLVDVGTGRAEIAPDSPARGFARAAAALMNTLTEDHTYPVNKQGETYGSMMLADVVNEIPDLISAKNADGVSGYIRYDDIRPVGKDGLKAYYAALKEDNTIPLYDLAGRVIGTFEIGKYEKQMIDAADIEAVKAAVEANVGDAADIEAVKASLDSAPGKSVSDNVTTSAESVRARLTQKYLPNGEYPTTPDGKTYGPIGLIPHVYPDLVGVVASNGKKGYAKFEEFDPYLALLSNPNTTREELKEARKHLSDYANTLIPVYDLKGNVIGEFLRNASE